jgi:hypothetical protein
MVQSAVKLALGIALVAFTASASATPITYTWQGNAGVTGSFTLDSSAFSSPSTFENVSQSLLTAFNFVEGWFTFDFADVNDSAFIFFDSTVSPPSYRDGGGTAATNPAGDELAFFTDSIQMFVPSGPLESVDDFHATSNVPEPGTFVLVGAGVLGLGSLVRRKSMAR